MRRGALHILLVADGSSEAVAAAGLVRLLVDPTSVARITVVAAVAPIDLTVLPGSWVWAVVGMVPQVVIDDAQRVARERAEEALRRELATLVGLAVPVEPILRTGWPATEIVTAAHELDADLIVLGSHGRTGLRTLWRGGIASAVLRQAPCPVVVVCPADAAPPPSRGRRHPTSWLRLPVLQRTAPLNGATANQLIAHDARG